MKRIGALLVFILAVFCCRLPVFAQDHFNLKIITLSEDSSLNSDGFELKIIAQNHFEKTWKQFPGQSVNQIVPAGKCTVSATTKILGYSTKYFTLSKDTTIIFNWKYKIPELDYVIITHNRFHVPTGMERINISDIKKIPSLLGEPDALKVLQFTPGVQTGGEGSSGFFVRGGSLDQNLFLYDGTPLYNVSHMFGLLSVFNPDVISGVSLYKGSFPAKYGGRLSSVIDVDSRDGNRYKTIISGGNGLIASRLTVETPIARDSTKKNGKGSLLLSGRRTYADVFTRLINTSKSGDQNFTPIPTYYFYDFNGKLSFSSKPGINNFISFYTGSDFLKYQEGNGLNYSTNWNNTAITIGTQRYFNEKLSLQASIFHSGFFYNVVNETDVYNLTLRSKINDFGARANFIYNLNKQKNNNYISFGTQVLHQQFSPQNIYANADAIDLNYEKTNKLKANQAALFAEYIWNPKKWFILNAGSRVSAYMYKNSVFINPEPRANAGLQLVKNDKLSLDFKSAYTRMFQYVHLISNNMASFPTDVWYPVTQNIKPQKSDAVSAGWHAAFYKNKYLASLEGYYKFLTGVVEYAEGADILMEPDFEKNLVTGNGNSYGLELMLKKQTGRFTGSLAYTLSWSKRQFDEKNFGRVYYASFDRRHNLNTTFSYTINERAELNLAWVFASGNAITLPTGRAELLNLFPYTGGEFPLYTEKNNYRAPAFHHLDLSFTWKFKPKKGESSLNAGIYNIYNRRNPYFIYLPTVRNGNTAYTKPEQVSILPLIPSVTYNFKF